MKGIYAAIFGDECLLLQFLGSPKRLDKFLGNEKLV